MDKITIMSEKELDLFISNLFDEVTLTEVIINDFVDVCLNQICTELINSGYSFEWVEEIVRPRIIEEYNLQSEFEYEKTL